MGWGVHIILYQEQGESFTNKSPRRTSAPTLPANNKGSEDGARTYLLRSGQRFKSLVAG